MDSEIDILRYISIMSMTKYGYPIFNIISDNTYKIVDINSSLRKKSEIDDLFSDKSEELVEDNDKTL